MAINPETQYPGKINPSNAAYPYGSARNITVPGDGTGTPWESAIVNDQLGLLQSLLSAASIVPTGSPDQVGASQYLDAIHKILGATHETVAAALADTTLKVGNDVRTSGYDAQNDGGAGAYVIKTAAQAGIDGDIIDGFGNHTLASGNVLILRADGWVNVKQYGLKGDRLTDDSAAQSALSASPHLFIYWPSGIFQTGITNGTSNRTYLFAEDCIIDGVVHITGTGPATTPPQGSVTWVDNVRMLGTVNCTVRFGTFYTRKLNVDKIRITEVSGSYINQTATGGSTGVHLFFGTKSTEIGEIICDSGALSYNLSVDQGPVKGADELTEDIHIGKLTVRQTDVTALVTAETVGLSIDEIIIKNQGGPNVAWISSNDKKLKVGKITHNGTGADSGQVGIYLQNTDPDSSAEFGTVDVSNVPGIGFRTFSVGTVEIGTLIATNNREGCRLQSKCTIQHIKAVDNSEQGVYIFDNFAAGSFIGSVGITGPDGIGLTVGSDDITIPYIKTDGFATLYGLQIPAGTENFITKYVEAANCSQGVRCLSAGPVDLGVINLHDNVNGFIGSGLDDFSFDYVLYDNNTTDTNTVLESAPGFRGKKIRQSVSADRGDASVTLAIGADQVTQQFNTPLTANRTITLTSPATNGDKFRIVRTAAATGAFTLTVTLAGGNKVLAVGEWAEVEFHGSNWLLTAAGAL